MNINESMLIESKSARNFQLANFSDERILDILGKANGLIHFAQVGSDRLATIDQMAEFYEVPEDTIKTCLKRNREEFEADGVTVLRGKARVSRLREVRVNMNLPEIPCKTTVLTALNPRSGLRLGMLLRDSAIAEAVRNGVLDLVESEPVDQVQPIQSGNEDVLLSSLKALVAIREHQSEQDRVLAKQQEAKEMLLIEDFTNGHR